MTEKFDAHIAALDVEITATQNRLTELTARRTKAVSDRAKALADGITTSGDHIRDLVLRVHGAPDEALEKRFKTVQELFTNRVGELALVTYSQRLISHSRRGGPGDSYDEYHDEWFIACGIVAGEKLCIEHNTIVFPIERYAGSAYPFLAEVTFALCQNPFASPYQYGVEKPNNTIDAYAEPGKDEWGELRLIVGDTHVRAYFDSQRRLAGKFQSCCAVLSKLILEPTDE